MHWTINRDSGARRKRKKPKAKNPIKGWITGKTRLIWGWWRPEQVEKGSADCISPLRPRQSLVLPIIGLAISVNKLWAAEDLEAAFSPLSPPIRQALGLLSRSKVEHGIPSYWYNSLAYRSSIISGTRTTIGPVAKLINRPRRRSCGAPFAEKNIRRKPPWLEFVWGVASDLKSSGYKQFPAMSDSFRDCNSDSIGISVWVSVSWITDSVSLARCVCGGGGVVCDIASYQDLFPEKNM